MDFGDKVVDCTINEKCDFITSNTSSRTNETLETVTIHDNVVSLCNYCFYGCLNLKEVDIGENSKLSLIGEKAFSRDPDSKRKYNINHLDLPKSLVLIEEYAFIRSNITEINFMDKTNWTAGTEAIKESDLADPKHAAMLLEDLYSGQAWDKGIL